MSNIDVISMAVRNLVKRKLRTSLTLLGVVIGTVSIIIMVSIGIASSENIEQMLQNFGDVTVIEVRESWNDVTATPEQKRFASKKGKLILNDNAVEEFNNMDGVVIATALLETGLKSVSGKYISNLNVIGIDPEAMEPLGFKIAKGRSIEETDKMGAVFGGRIASNYSDPNDRNGGGYFFYTDEEVVDVINPFEDKILVSRNYSLGERKKPGQKAEKIISYKLDVVGVMEKGGGWSTDYSVFMAKSQVEKILEAERKQKEKETGKREQPKEGYSQVTVKCESIDVVMEVQEKIKALGFENAYANAEWVQNLKKTSATSQMLLGAIGGVSLVVAAIGITNTMVMSIYERTREIGVMKVIGAAVKDVRKIFLIEASLIGFLGGVVGVGISLALSYAINKYGGEMFNGLTMGGGGPDSKISSIPTWLCPVSLLFTALIGLLSGYLPAKRATKLSALTAIKTE